MSDKFVYKILGERDWAAAQEIGRTSTALDEGDGYVHLSTRAQVGETLALHYKGSQNTRLLEYALEGLGDVRWEASRGGQMFPHLYDELPISSAHRTWRLSNDKDGVPVLPEDIDYR